MQKENGTEYCTVFYLFNFNYRVNIYSININMKVSTVISVLCRNMLRLQHNGSGHTLAANGNCQSAHRRNIVKGAALFITVKFVCIN